MKKRINLSQSFVKSYTKVYDNSACGKEIEDLYINKSFKKSQGKESLAGQFFEYLFVLEMTGKELTNRDGTTPQPPKTATGNVSKAEKLRIENQVQNMKKIFKAYDIEILAFNETLEYNYSETKEFEFWRKGVLDLRVKFNNYFTNVNGYIEKFPPFEAIIDLKYSGNLSEKNKTSEYSFYVDEKFKLYEQKQWIKSLENRDNLTIQAVEYKHLANRCLSKDLRFFFFIASSTASEQIELIEVKVSESRRLRHEDNISFVAKQLNFYGCKLAANPKFSFCSKCENDTCNERISIQQIKSIEI